MMLLGSGHVALFHLTPPDELWLWASEGDTSTAIAATEASNTGEGIMDGDVESEETEERADVDRIWPGGCFNVRKKRKWEKKLKK